MERPIFLNHNEVGLPLRDLPQVFDVQNDQDPGFTPEVRGRVKRRLLAAFSEEKSRLDGWEPFASEPDTENQKFIVTYGGPFAQRLEIHRERAERLIGVAALEGKIVLTDLAPNRERVISGVNPDMSVTAKRRLFLGERLELPSMGKEERKNSLITRIPQGWMISINGEMILNELSQQESKKSLAARFAARFNKELGESLISILWKDKISLYHPNDNWRLIQTLAMPALSSLSLPDGLQVKDIIAPVLWLAIWGGMNSMNKILYDKGIYPEPLYRRSLSSLYEFLMPPIEVDRYLRGLAYLNIKSRNLMRIAPDK